MTGIVIKVGEYGFQC